MRAARALKLLAALGLIAWGSAGNASLEDDGTWAAGVWATTVWADGVWYESAAPGDTTGALSTTFTSSAVPDTAVYNRGTAFTPAGARYVRACASVAVYLAGVGHTNDGATCIDASGDIAYENGGWALTVGGEVAAAECAPEYYINGVPRDSVTFKVCMTNVD